MTREGENDEEEVNDDHQLVMMMMVTMEQWMGWTAGFEGRGIRFEEKESQQQTNTALSPRKHTTCVTRGVAVIALFGTI